MRAAATAAAAAAAGEAAARAAARERGELANARPRAVPSMPGGMAQRRMGERVGERERVGEVERQGSHGGGGRGVSRDGGGGGGRDSGGRECVAMFSVPLFWNAAWQREVEVFMKVSEFSSKSVFNRISSMTYLTSSNFVSSPQLN